MSSQYRFLKTPDPENQFDFSTIEVVFPTESLPDLLQEFEYFLRGCGFHFDGSLEIVEEDY